MRLGKAIATGYAEERAEARVEDAEETVVAPQDEAPAAAAEEPEPVVGR